MESSHTTPTHTLKQVPVVVLWHVTDAHMNKMVVRFQDVRLIVNANVAADTAQTATERPFTSRSVWSDTGVTEDECMFASSNVLRFQRFTRGQEGYGDGGCCFYCRDQFEHAAMGVPVTLRQIDADLVIIHMYDVLCSFECTLAWIASMRASNSAPTDLDEAERILKSLYVLQYPEGAILQPALPFRLAPGYEGPLTYAEFWSWRERQVFRSLPSVILAPARVIYVAPTTPALAVVPPLLSA